MQTHQVTITIDTYSFVHNLKNAGFSEEQAKAVMTEIMKINLHNMASKDDIIEVKAEIKDAKFDIIKWILPFILGIYALIAYKH